MQFRRSTLMKTHLETQFTFILFLLTVLNAACPPGYSTLAVGEVHDSVNFAFRGCIKTEDVIQNCNTYLVPSITTDYQIIKIADVKCEDCVSFGQYNQIVKIHASDSFHYECVFQGHVVESCLYYKYLYSSDGEQEPILQCQKCPDQSVKVNKTYMGFYQQACVDKIDHCALLNVFVVEQLIQEFQEQQQESGQGYPYLVTLKANCQLCDYGFILQQIPPICIPLVPYCNAYQPDGNLQCKECINGYLLNGKVCAPQLIPIPNIIISCPETQYLDLNKQCKPKTIVNCFIYDPSGVCLFCKQPFFLNKNQTKCLEQFICPPNNETIRYEIINGLCIPIDIHCDPNGFLASGCIICSQGFYNLNGRCFPIYRECNESQYRNKNGTCVPGNVDFCQQYSDQGKCLNCSTLFTLNQDGSKCTYVQIYRPICPNDTDIFQYLYYKNKCVAVDRNCEQNSYNQNGCCFCKCTYYLQNKRCIKSQVRR